MPEEKNTGYVLNVDCKYSPKISVYRLDTGDTVTYKLQKKLYQKNPFDQGAIIYFYSELRNKSKLVDGQWQKIDEKELWISNYLVKYDL